MPAEKESELPLVLLSHRGPVSFGREGDRRTATKGSGGLVTALLGLAEHLSDAVWVCAASSDEDIAVSRSAGGRSVQVQTSPQLGLVEETSEAASGAETDGDGSAEDGRMLEVRMVETDAWAHEAFYTVVSNPILWFIQHGLYGLTFAPVLTANEHAAFTDGYAAVNRSFADAVAEEVEARGGKALVMLQDYHFYLVAGHVRKRCPDALLSHFVHIPWPGPDSWRVLPPYMRNELLLGLLGSDVVAFHTERYARNFIHCVKELLGLPVNLDQLSVEVDGRTVYAKHYPISVDPAALEAVAETEEVASHAATLTEMYLADRELEEGTDGGDRRLIVRVDRTDPSKNVVRGFLAFGAMLDQHPELAGKVSFLALLQPSRTDVAEYSDYIATIGAVVAEINARHTRNGQQPIDLRMVEDFPLAVAAYSICDVLMVNALADGMNLVAKEVPVVNRRDGVLALSENTGAHEELGTYAVTLYPFDIQQMADALYEALTMPQDERHRLLTAAATQVREHDVAAWLSAQLRDLGEIRSDVPSPQ